MKVTEVPVGAGPDAPSLMAAVMMEVLNPSAGIVSGLAERTMLATILVVNGTTIDWVTLCELAVTTAEPPISPALRGIDTTPVSSGVIAV